MQTILDQMDNVVRPALKDYLNAEMALNDASAILQNVFDAWMRLLKQPLPPVSQY